LQFARIRPQRLSDKASRFADQRIGWICVDPGRSDLGVPEDALNHVHVDVLLPQQRPRGVPGVVQPSVLGDARLGEQGLPLFPVVVRVDRLALSRRP
jgi:hypothetical protein